MSRRKKSGASSTRRPTKVRDWRDSAGEAERLAALRRRTPDFIDDDRRDAFDHLFHGKNALPAFERARSRFYGHSTWQSTQPYVGRAIASARAAATPAGRARAIARIREVGQYFEGGSIEGHANALHALLATYDRLEEWPPFPAEGDGLDDDLRTRLAARNALLRDEVRATCAVRLGLLARATLAANAYKSAKADDSLAGEGALVAGDLAHAEQRFRKVASARPSWMTDMSRGDPRIAGFLGLARVARARKAHALVFKHVDAALGLDRTNAKALLLGMAEAEAVRLLPRARKYLRVLRKAHPLDDVRLDDLSRAEVEARLGPLDPRFTALLDSRKALAARDFRAVIEASERLFGKAKPALDGPRREPAAAFLYALAETGDFRRLATEAARFLAADRTFVSAREALAFAHGKLGRRTAGEELARTGLAALYRKDAWRDPREWAKLSPADALSPRPVFFTERAEALFMMGATDAGLAVLGVAPVPKHDPIRWLAAGSRFRQAVLGSELEKKTAAKDAWAWIEPLTTGLGEKHPLAVRVMVAGIEIAHALGDLRRVLGVKVPYEATAYRSLTGRAHAYVAPLIADALIALKRPEKAIAMIEKIFSDAKDERSNVRLIEAWGRAEALVKTTPKRRMKVAPATERPARPTAEERAAAHVFGDEILLRLSDEAWAHEQRGENEAAIAKYLAAAEAQPERGSIGLGNAGNLLTLRRDRERAWRFLSAALTSLSGLSPDGRAPVLAQVAHHFRGQGRHADALPSAALAFELEPTAERAGLLALDYLALGDRARAQAACTRGERLDPRHPELRRARAALTAAG